MTDRQPTPSAGAPAWWHHHPQPTVVLDESDRVLDLNPPAQALLACPVQALHGRPWRELCPGAAGHVRGITLAWTPPVGDGSVGPRLLQVREGDPFEHEGRRLRLLSLQDQAADRTALLQLFKRMFDGLHDGVLHYDGQLMLKDANRAALRFFGMASLDALRHRADDPQFLLQREDGSTVPPDERPTVRALRTGQAVEAEVLGMRLPNGQQRWALVNVMPTAMIAPVLGDGVVATFADVTAAHEARLALQQRLAAEQQLSRVVATAPGSLFSYRLSAAGRITVHMANPRVAEAYGLNLPAEAGGVTDLRDQVLPEDREALRQGLEASARSMKAWRGECRVRHPRRGLMWIELHAMPVREDDGDIVWHGFLHDITPHKQVEAEIRRLNAELETRVAQRTAELQARHKEMESFTYSVSHDLKAPLRGIDGYSRLLLTEHADKLDEEGRFFVQTIRKATLQMGRLIDDLLAYSRLERARSSLGPIDPAALVRQLLAERRHDLAPEQVELVLNLEEGQTRGEREGLLMALRNLLDNALKFSAGRPARRIEISCRHDEQGCHMTVADNGPGFDMQYHDRIFEIFQRLHRAEDYPGTGVGLAIVRKAVERMHGQVRALGKPGEGATFFIDLPPAGLANTADA
jgi:PAS domain S-box-containing protein